MSVLTRQNKAKNVFGTSLVRRLVYASALLFACGSINEVRAELPADGANSATNRGVVEYKGEWYQAGDTIYGYKNYIKLVVGDAQSPLLLGIPHDGVLPGNPEIPETGRTGRDINTKPFTFALAAAFKKDTKLQPWIIINEIHRKRADPNTYPKGVDERYGVDTEARKTYDSYHELLTFARSTMAANLPEKGGLFVDMHGHARKYAGGQSMPYTSIISGSDQMSRFVDHSEIGYGLSSAWIAEPDSALDKRAEWSSIAAIARANPETPFSELIRGKYSLGALLQREGVISVPSDVIPFPERNQALFGTTKDGQARRRPYFTGGFVTRKYGTATEGNVVGLEGNISTIQIETPGITVRNNARVYSRSSVKFKRAIIAYLNHWYGYDFRNR